MQTPIPETPTPAALQNILRVADPYADEFDAARAAIARATGGDQ